MRQSNDDMARARDAALACVTAVRHTFDSVFAVATGDGFMQHVTRLQRSVEGAADTIVPLLHEFADANQHGEGPTCAGVTVQNAPPSHHALAMEMADKLLKSVAPMKRLPDEALTNAVRDLHREILQVMPGENALAQLTEAKSVFTSEFDMLESKLWTESSMAEILRATGRSRAKAKAPKAASAKPRAKAAKKKAKKKKKKAARKS